MSRPLKTAAVAVLALIAVAVGLVAWRIIREGQGTGVAMLTPVPGATGFEPTDRPSGPVIRSKATPGALDVAFGYEVGGVPYSYTLALRFAPGASEGRAVASVHHDGHDASTETEAARRWDEPRKGYAVALSDKFMISPPVPALCIKAVLGPDLARWNLADGTICVAQRDSGGGCHPETLACGLLR